MIRIRRRPVASGSRRVNAAPPPGRSSTVTSPPWAVAICCTIHSPRPLPSDLVVKNGSKMADRLFAGNARPVVAHPQEERRAPGSRAHLHLDAPAVFDRLDGVDHEIDQRLLELGGIGDERRESLRTLTTNSIPRVAASGRSSSQT